MNYFYSNFNFIQYSFSYAELSNNHQPIADDTSSATSGLVDLTVNCIATPSDRANLARSNISCPPLKVPVKHTHRKREKNWKVGRYLSPILLNSKKKCKKSNKKKSISFNKKHIQWGYQIFSCLCNRWAKNVLH